MARQCKNCWRCRRKHSTTCSTRPSLARSPMAKRRAPRSSPRVRNSAMRSPNLAACLHGRQRCSTPSAESCGATTAILMTGPDAHPDQQTFVRQLPRRDQRREASRRSSASTATCSAKSANGASTTVPSGVCRQPWRVGGSSNPSNPIYVGPLRNRRKSQSLEKSTNQFDFLAVAFDNPSYSVKINLAGALSTHLDAGVGMGTLVHA